MERGVPSHPPMLNSACVFISVLSLSEQHRHRLYFSPAVVLFGPVVTLTYTTHLSPCFVPLLPTRPVSPFFTSGARSAEQIQSSGRNMSTSCAGNGNDFGFIYLTNHAFTFAEIRCTVIDPLAMHFCIFLHSPKLLVIIRSS